ncbi:ankyrin repeat-containing domain protein [Entophlyctis helioformis]|nr:ankyrin repeat-containing domain protein [Entophlyctis helioformis]
MPRQAFTLYLSRFPQIITWANKDGQTALIIATQKGHIGMIQALLDMGVDVHSVDADGSTPLHHAAAYGYIECVDILLEHGASPSLVNKMGWSSIDYAYSNELKQRLEARSS